MNGIDGVRRDLQGIIKTIDFGPDGVLFLYKGGVLSIARNLNEKGGENTVWLTKDSTIRGDGFVEYLSLSPFGTANYEGFIGTLQPNNALFNTDVTGVSVKSIVRDLINEVSGLSEATVYTDNSGTRRLRLKNGVRVDIGDDTIVSEDSTGNVFGTSSAGESVTYSYPTGTRVLGV